MKDSEDIQTRIFALQHLAEDAEQSRIALWTQIRVCHQYGASLREIARAAGISHEQVRRIVSDE